MKKSFRILTICVALVLVLTACGKKNQQEGEIVGGEYTTSGYQKGGIPVTSPNAKTMTVQDNGSTVDIVMTFSSGSLMSGGSEEKEIGMVPNYTVYTYGSPSRLVIEFDTLAYWDYTRSANIKNPLINGYFQHSVFNSPTVSIYVQLSENVSFNVSESLNKLTISLKKEPANDAEGVYKYYVIANAYREYCNGTISRELDMQPVMASNFQDILLISKGFSEQKDAEQFRVSTINMTENAIEGQWSVVALYENQLPPYDEEQAYSGAFLEEAVRINGKPQRIDVLIPNGRYLVSTPNEDGYLFSKRVSGMEDNLPFKYEEIWYKSADGEQTKRMLNYEFSAIEEVSYSLDGRRIAVTEQNEETKNLYIFDADTKELMLDLTTVGFGNMISATAWNSFGNVLYAVSGSSTMRVHQYDFNVPDESKRYSLVENKDVDEGSLCYYNGEVYYVLSDSQNASNIMRIKPEGGVRKLYTAGSGFSLSPDSRYMAITNAADAAATGGFTVRDMNTGEDKKVETAFKVFEFTWAHDGESIFFFENKLSGNVSEDETSTGTDDPEQTDDPNVVTDKYPYTLWQYTVSTGELRQLADLMSTSITPSIDPAVLLVHYMDVETSGERINATYILNINK